MNAETMMVKAPWLSSYGEVPAHLDYQDGSLFEAVERCAETYPDYTAYIFMGRKTSYKMLIREINLCARALKAIRHPGGGPDHGGSAQLPSDGGAVLCHQPGGSLAKHDPSPVPARRRSSSS